MQLEGLEAHQPGPGGQREHRALATHEDSEQLGRPCAQEARACVAQLPCHFVHLRPQQYTVQQPCHSAREY